MYLCYHIDLQAGVKHRADVFEAVSYPILEVDSRDISTYIS